MCTVTFSDVASTMIEVDSEPVTDLGVLFDGEEFVDPDGLIDLGDDLEGE